MRSANRALSILTVVAASVALAAPAMAAPEIDQQTVVDPDWGYSQSGYSWKDGPMATSFTAGLTGALTQVDLPFCCGSGLNPEDLTIGIHAMTDDGLPGGSALASEMPSTEAWRELGNQLGTLGMERVGTLSVSFTSPAQVKAEKRYAIVMSVSPGSGNWYQWFLEDARSPSGNQAFNADTTNPAAWVWSEWVGVAGAFTTWVDTSRAAGGGAGAGAGAGGGGAAGGGSSAMGASQQQLRFTSKGADVGALVSPGGSRWMELPRLASTERAGGRFLGWSTSPDFPVDVAAKQVADGGGAIDDTFNGERMIFIPAGGSALITGDNHLYAIWE